MFMAQDVIQPRDYGAMHLYSSLVLTNLRNAALDVHDMKYADSDEKNAWDKFYSTELGRPEWRAELSDDTPKSFLHGAVHDAESVFWICVLYFCRILPKGTDMSEDDWESIKRERGELFQKLRMKTPGEAGSLTQGRVKFFCVEGIDHRLREIYSSLALIYNYSEMPWYNVAGTGRGEKYEFHLHDFMQRLLWKHIAQLRDAGDPILVEPDPLAVKTYLQIRTTGDASTHLLRSVPSTVSVIILLHSLARDCTNSTAPGR